MFHSTEYDRITGREMGYVYFQDFIPGNDSDIRVFVVGDKAYALKRMVRKDDFRASGSGIYKAEKENFNEELIRQAFEISEKLRTQCLVFDFVFLNDKPLVLEISYGTRPAYNVCHGYFDRELNWHEGHFDLGEAMVEEVLGAVMDKKKNS